MGPAGRVTRRETQRRISGLQRARGMETRLPRAGPPVELGWRSEQWGEAFLSRSWWAIGRGSLSSLPRFRLNDNSPWSPATLSHPTRNGKLRSLVHGGLRGRGSFSRSVIVGLRGKTASNGSESFSMTSCASSLKKRQFVAVGRMKPNFDSSRILV